MSSSWQLPSFIYSLQLKEFVVCLFFYFFFFAENSYKQYLLLFLTESLSLQVQTKESIIYNYTNLKHLKLKYL